MPSGSQLAQFTFSGLTSGSLYALVALSLVLVYRASGAVNFAQGEFIVFGALSTGSFLSWGLPLFAAVPLAVVTVMTLGVLVESLLVRRLLGSSVAAVITLTIGSSLALRGIALVIWGRQGQAMDPFVHGSLHVAGATLPYQVLWNVGAAAVIVAGLWFFLERTMLGLALRSVADDPAGAHVIGVSQRAVSRFSWACGAGMAGLAGAFVAPLLFVNYGSGVMPMVKGFVAMALGGMTSTVGAAVSGLLLGLGEAYVIGLASSYVADVLVFSFLILILLLRPEGLFGGRAAGWRP